MVSAMSARCGVFSEDDHVRREIWAPKRMVWPCEVLRHGWTGVLVPYVELNLSKRPQKMRRQAGVRACLLVVQKRKAVHVFLGLPNNAYERKLATEAQPHSVSYCI